MTVVHLMQASLKFDLDRDQQERTLEDVYDRGADVIGHSEAVDHKLLADLAGDYGYRLVHPWRGHGRRASTALAIRRDEGRIRLIGSGYVNTTEGQTGPARLGGHGPRGLTMAELEVEGNVLHVSELHVVTGWGQPGRAPGRSEKVLDQWQDSTRLAARLGRGSDLSVLMGDVNYDPDDRSPNTPSEVLKAAGWTSALEEAGRPDLPTHHRRTIDQLYTLDRDKRVSVAKVKAWPPSAYDHRQVSVWLDLAPRGAR